MTTLPSMDTPEEGFYKMRLVRNGPWVPVKIWFSAVPGSEDQTPIWHCLVNNQPADVWGIWPWVGGRGISEEEYKRLEPQRSPDKPIDKLKTPLKF